MFKDIIETRMKELYKQNLQDLKNNLNNQDYQYKINNFVLRTGFDKKEVINKIKTDEMFAFFFIKDPKKQILLKN